MENNLEIGLVVEVRGFFCKIATFDNTNHSTFIDDGKLIKNISVNSFIAISQGLVKIIARINSESMWDIQNNTKDYNLDRRFSKNTIKRVLEVQTIGYIKQNVFYSGASFLPMIGNICSIPTNEDINRIYINNYNSESNNLTINIGESLVEQTPINLPINPFFASHIGIFGNTGSGKSNTLHKLYYELFSKKELVNLKKNSKFLVLDFNGEYIQDESFGQSMDNKEVYKLSSKENSGTKFPIEIDTFFDDEMLSVLFSASTQTQKPFISRITKGMKKYGSGNESLIKWLKVLIRSVFSERPNPDIKDRLVQVLIRKFPSIESIISPIIKAKVYSKDEKTCFLLMQEQVYFDGDWSSKYESALKFEEITSFLGGQKITRFAEFEIRCEFQLIQDMLYNNVQEKHINPLIRRINSQLNDVSKYITLVERLPKQKFLQIVSLKNLKHDSKKILSLLISKMYFDKHKKENTFNKLSFHLIIDEAHNILSTQSNREYDNWKDYRLELFEEIIKEGRKFSFFLTISSQRPADISPTILSQIHNYFLHKLVNERDLLIIDNAISTLDRTSKAMLPVLSQGVCVISGTAISMPITVKVGFINDKTVRPKSDTVILTDIWTKNDRSKKANSEILH